MSSIYTCRARVGYRPVQSPSLILFEEKQISELSVKLKWEPNLGSSNADTGTPVGNFVNSLAQSTASVTIVDPYLSGVAWPAMFDAAAIYSGGVGAAATNGMLLRACEPGEDPATGKCFRYADTELKLDDSGGMGGSENYALLYVSLWYDVAGASFGTDFIFRINGFSIEHGVNYPSVTLRGTDARSLVFNQSLINVNFDENEEVESALKKIVEKFGFEPQFCSNTNADPYAKRVLPKTIAYNNVTPNEAISKILGSVGGNSLSLPITSVDKKISICARGEVNQGCSVFYLGRGLYEGFEINGSPELSLVEKNRDQNSGGNARNERDPYASETFDAKEYAVQNVAPVARKAAFEKLGKVPTMPDQFNESSKHIKAAPTTSGPVWKSFKPPASPTGPLVVTQEQLKSANFFGVQPSGEKAKVLLPGKVTEVDTTAGRVTIATDFDLLICEAASTKKCFIRKIYQETVNLTGLIATSAQVVVAGGELGTSTKEKPELTRLFIYGHNKKVTTIIPKIAWEYGIPQAEAIKKYDELNPPAAPEVTSTATDQSGTSQPPPSKFIASPNFRSRNGTTIDKIYVHYTVGNTAQAAIDTFLVPGGNSAHYIIGKDGSITQMVKDSDSAQHAEKENSRSIGIEHVANVGEKMTAPQNAASVKLIKSLMAKYRIPPSGIKAHKETSSTQCPGSLFGDSQQGTDLNGFKSWVSKNFGADSAPAQPPGPATVGSSGLVARIGNTGSSTGPHLHAQWGDKRPITIEQVREFVDVAGVLTSGYGPRWGKNHNGVDIGNARGTPISIKNGATLAQIVDSKCREGDTGCGGGFGNHIIINTPKGPMILAHLLEDSVTGTPGGGGTSPSGSSNADPALQASPVTKGLTVETSFKGVPRALRITPGRTILSFITNYDEWLEAGGHLGADTDIDPGIWIPRRFKSWFVKEVEYKWREGDLRVNLEGASQWGKQATITPTFNNYLAGMKAAGEMSNTNDYFGYIRSVGDLAWKISVPGSAIEDSTSKFCPEAQAWSDVAAAGSDSTAATPDVSSGFPTGKCQYTGNKYPKDRVNGILNAAYSAGVKTKAGLAGIVGNALHESNQGGYLNPSALNPTSGAYGIFQWLGSRKTGLANFARSQGKPTSDFGVQMQWFIKELRGADFRGKETIDELNKATDPADAANKFNIIFERAPGQGVAQRLGYAKEVFTQMTCSA